MPCLTNRFSILENCTDDIQYTLAMESSPTVPLEDMPINDPDPNHILIRSSRLRNSTELQLHIESVSSHHPMGVTALLDSGATGLFIDADYVHAKNLTTQ